MEEVKRVDGSDVGKYTTIAAPDQNTVYISYYDEENHSVKFISSFNGGTTWNTPVSVYTAPDEIKNISMAAVDDTIWIGYWAGDWDLDLGLLIDLLEQMGVDVSFLEPVLDTLSGFVPAAQWTLERLMVVKSSDAGKNWEDPEEIIWFIDGPEVTDIPYGLTASWRNHGISMAAPDKDTVFISYVLDIACQGALMVSRSTDGGDSWPAYDYSIVMVGTPANGLGGDPSLSALDEDTVYITYQLSFGIPGLDFLSIGFLLVAKSQPLWGGAFASTVWVPSVPFAAIPLAAWQIFTFPMFDLGSCTSLDALDEQHVYASYNMRLPDTEAMLRLLIDYLYEEIMSALDPSDLIDMLPVDDATKETLETLAEAVTMDLLIDAILDLVPLDDLKDALVEGIAAVCDLMGIVAEFVTEEIIAPPLEAVIAPLLEDLLNGLGLPDFLDYIDIDLIIEQFVSSILPCSVEYPHLMFSRLIFSLDDLLDLLPGLPADLDLDSAPAVYLPFKSVDRDSRRGNHNSIAAADENNIFISYFDEEEGYLMEARSADGGDTWVTEIMDTDVTCGEYSSINAVKTDTTIFIFISYNAHHSPGKLKFLAHTPGPQTYYPGTFSLDTDADEEVDTVNFVLSDLDSDGDIDRLELSLDGTFGLGDLFRQTDGMLQVVSDERLDAGPGSSTSKIILLGAHRFDVTFQHQVGAGQATVSITAKWYIGTIKVDIDEDQIDNVLDFCLVDHNSDGLFTFINLDCNDSGFYTVSSPDEEHLSGDLVDCDGLAMRVTFRKNASSVALDGGSIIDVARKRGENQWLLSVPGTARWGDVQDMVRIKIASPDTVQPGFYTINGKLEQVGV